MLKTGRITILLIEKRLEKNRQDHYLSIQDIKSPVYLFSFQNIRTFAEQKDDQIVYKA